MARSVRARICFVIPVANALHSDGLCNVVLIVHELSRDGNTLQASHVSKRAWAI